MTHAQSQSKSKMMPLAVILLLLLLILQLSIAGGAEEGQRAITRPGCPDKCGNLSIPFPFGMKPGCFLEGFQVSCNDSTEPPRAFLVSSTTFKILGADLTVDASDMPGTVSPTAPAELFNISVAASEAWGYGAVTSLCSTSSSSQKQNLTMQLSGVDEKGRFRLSMTRNVVIGVGSKVQPKVTTSKIGSWWNDALELSCMSSVMDDPRYATNGSCMGAGCCQADLPQNAPPMTAFGVFLSHDNSSGWGSFPCSYGMMVARSWYNFSSLDLNGLSSRFPRGVPYVLDFAVGDASCPADGLPPPPDYACVSGNSSCANATSGKGYVCKCWEHYDGNPYISNGCQDINECELPQLNNCSTGSTCKNTLGGYECPCKSGMRGDGKHGSCTQSFPLPAKIAVGIAASVVVFILMVMAYQLLTLKRFYEQNGGPILKGVKNIRIYTKKQLKHITENYKNAIGEGHFGKVYMGTLEDKQKVAIKKSIKVDDDRRKEFIDEVIIQSGMRHKNIVRLLGCCLQMDVPMLVYEFVAQGSLYDVLFKKKDKVSADTRLRIAVGSAEGLTYMHSAVEDGIRHGDVKSANILLDETFTPKVSDFGTSRLLARGKSETTDLVVGDMGYIDPVYMQHGIVTQKSDVYSFGIVLIELITRRAATYDDKGSYVANFVQAFLDKRARNFIDNDITREEDIKLLEIVSGVAVDCLKTRIEERLDMKQVEHRLQEIIGQSAQHAQEIKHQGSLSPTPDDVALFKVGES